MFAINDRAAIAEVLAIYKEYEVAQACNDIEKLTTFFWESECTLRFGVDESLHGASEIEASCEGGPANDLETQALDLRIVTFGEAHAVVAVEFKRIAQGVLRHGRQSLVWVKFPEGWKIVSAHVSYTPNSYAELAAGLIGLPLPAQYADEVRKNIERAALIAAPLLAMPLADEVESAQVFHP